MNYCGMIHYTTIHLQTDTVHYNMTEHNILCDVRYNTLQRNIDLPSSGPCVTSQATAEVLPSCDSRALSGLTL